MNVPHEHWFDLPLLSFFLVLFLIFLSLFLFLVLSRCVPIRNPGKPKCDDTLGEEIGS